MTEERRKILVEAFRRNPHIFLAAARQDLTADVTWAGIPLTPEEIRFMNHLAQTYPNYRFSDYVGQPSRRRKEKTSVPDDFLSSARKAAVRFYGS